MAQKLTVIMYTVLIIVVATAAHYLVPDEQHYKPWMMLLKGASTLAVCFLVLKAAMPLVSHVLLRARFRVELDDKEKAEDPHHVQPNRPNTWKVCTAGDTKVDSAYMVPQLSALFKQV